MPEHIPAYLETHTLAADELTFSLANQAEQLKAKVQPSGRAGATIVKQAGLTVVLIHMAKGNKLAEHRADGPVTIQVLSGLVKIAGDARDVTGEKGTLVAFGPQVEHSLEAEEDSTVLVHVFSTGN